MNAAAVAGILSRAEALDSELNLFVVSETGVAFGFCASVSGSLESTPEAAPTQRLKVNPE